MDKAYEAQKFEEKIYDDWQASGFFNPDKLPGQRTESFTIILPPPNATGRLHIGHAMMLAVQDLIIRFERMRGKKTLWLPGTDHAAIATNAIVEKQLAEQGQTKNDFSREVYVDKVKDFIFESQKNIRQQIRVMGGSLDWSREAYTWDEKRNLAVRTMFKKMYDDGLIYRGLRIVNWCPHCQSTLADDEVEYREQKTKLYTFYYSKNFPIPIATTRPETKFGDVAVAVQPTDKRYKKFIGKKFEILLDGVSRTITIIADKSVDAKFGTGAVGVTPAHSHVDAQMAKEAGLDQAPQVIGQDGLMTDQAGVYAGLDVLAARQKFVKWLEDQKLMKQTDDLQHNLSTCYRCHTAIEPLPSKQWFIDVNKEFNFQPSATQPIKGLKKDQKVSLKKLMQHVVKSQQIKIIPERFDKTYFHWIDNLRDWCISRQIWVGHQIPVWYKDDEVYVDVNPPQGKDWTQDPDTLDTWFSAGLWTFSTLGWPDLKSSDLKTYHPTQVMETMFDILFFWVARMIMMTTYALGEIPFETVYLHAKVLDRDGEKMSKSKPQTMIDPLDVCPRYGTDAVRLSLISGVAPGSDMRLSEDKIAGFRNFTNKLWNISRFIKSGLEKPEINIARPAAVTLSDKWILSRLDQTIETVTKQLTEFNFSLAEETLRTFSWDDLADWYLEIAKVEENKNPILNYILNNLLKLWHPFMPFVTEKIWQEFYGDKKADMLMIQSWPVADQTTVVKDFAVIKEMINTIRSARSDYKIAPTSKLSAIISGEKNNIVQDNIEIIKKLARLENLEVKKDNQQPAGWLRLTGSLTIDLEVAGQVDIKKEKDRLQREHDDLASYAKALQTKLSNKEFAAKAPASVVEAERQKLSDILDRVEKLSEQLLSLQQK